jgi:hypothetical protein
VNVEDLTAGTVVHVPRSSVDDPDVWMTVQVITIDDDGNVDVSGKYVNDPRTSLGFILPVGTDVEVAP